ncbi:HAD-IA family hydrolase [Streptomyces sp. MB09-01]|uniref:HAD family hydrolase n=1 Tax=Streptomyces sp. MB09-01 TaxID=3028666 RepID=UPI0029B388FE|nr:HAD-IA family hydrolase [Streptomyces sp. MB09-01]MDX3537875.1 HAD-IA family hydrolase [Streptomyces sp. MB09-01]
MTKSRILFETIAFDAMGVLYRSPDDVAELLVPYARVKGSTLGEQQIRELYTECSLGRIGTAELWEGLGTHGASDEEYCRAHELTKGAAPLLKRLAYQGIRLACLSNDVSVWSVLLRRRFRLDETITTWVISGDIGVRKPDPKAYEALCRAVDTADPGRVLFIDDRAANVAAARAVGLAALRYGAAETPEGTRAVRDMAELEEVLTGWTS